MRKRPADRRRLDLPAPPGRAAGTGAISRRDLGLGLAAFGAAATLLPRLAGAQGAGAPAPAVGEGGAIVSHGISTFGDLKYAPDFAHFDFVNPDAPKGGTWSGRGTGASSTFDSLNPFILKGEPAQGLGALYDTLLTGSPDEIDAVYGLLAESLEYPEDRTWVIFRLRPEATFSDGSPVTAEDVKFTFDILREQGHPSYRIQYRDVESATVLEERAIRFDFREGVSTRDLPAMVGGFAVLSKAWWAERDFSASTLEPILGSGPYAVEVAEPGRRIVYARRPDYWAADLPVNVGTNNFDRYVFEYFKDYTAAFEAFKAGAFTFHEEFFSKIWATEYGFPAIERGWVIKDQVPDGRPSGTQGFWFNMRRPQFQDPRVREALSMAFDFEWSNKTLFYGLYDRTVSFFENSPMEAEGMPSEAELALLEPLRADLPAEVFEAPAYTPPVTDGSGSDRRVLRRAMKLLDEAGWTVKDGMRVNAEGQPLKMELLDDSPTFERIIGPFIANLRKMGVDASMRIVDPAQYQQRQEDFDYDVVPGRFVMSMTPGQELRSLFGSDAAGSPGTPNLTGLANPAVDALIEKVIGADSRESLDVAARALDRVLRALHIWTPNWYKGEYNIAYWDVFGMPESPPPYSRGDGYWWWDEAKYEKLKSEGAPL
ncbi:extracellular solute-binding protein [Albimonas pacifica]|uniref:Microcin C transport system substrate-binding protein n=1 Tax=Albimonas pacifica TaxID=1114924 RepID=A0A1I3GP89_9RHOB|nr:extracellular solute-binding protein [Albimonas pacifica]SFI25112.1 microcin C transport system substrate-binding protein [Albimonas pacifica]